MGTEDKQEYITKENEHNHKYKLDLDKIGNKVKS